MLGGQRRVKPFSASPSIEIAWDRLTDYYNRQLNADPLRERRLYVARQIGEATFAAYWKGDAEIVAWIDRDFVELAAVFGRILFRDTNA